MRGSKGGHKVSMDGVDNLQFMENSFNILKCEKVAYDFWVGAFEGPKTHSEVMADILLTCH